MVDIPIPDNVYQLAAKAAQAHQVSVEAFVLEAVELRLQGEQLRLNSDQMATICKSQSEINSGKGLTVEQVETRLASKKAEWLAANPV